MNNIAIIHDNKGEYDQARSHALQAYGILERLKSPELDRSVEILSYIKERLGSEAYETLVKKVERICLSRVDIPCNQHLYTQDKWGALR